MKQWQQNGAKVTGKAATLCENTRAQAPYPALWATPPQDQLNAAQAEPELRDVSSASVKVSFRGCSLLVHYDLQVKAAR